MVTHWESSRRPLYVRTIWKDGQHHVILDKTKERAAELTHPRKTSKHHSICQNSHRSTKSVPAGANLRVSSVRVLLSGVSAFRDTQRSTRQQEVFPEKPRIWAKEKRPVTCKDLNKEISFESIQGFKAPSLHKWNTVDLGDRSVEESLPDAPTDVPNNALSEKVLLWLDLAAQNGPQHRAITAQSCQLLEKPRPMFEVRDSALMQDVLETSILKNNTPRADVVREEMIVISNEENELPEDDFYHVLASSVEETKCAEVIEEKKVKTAKRQLHIFMPNLPKRSSDCDSSILSSVR